MQRSSRLLLKLTIATNWLFSLLQSWVWKLLFDFSFPTYHIEYPHVRALKGNERKEIDGEQRSLRTLWDPFDFVIDRFWLGILRHNGTEMFFKVAFVFSQSILLLLECHFFQSVEDWKYFLKLYGHIRNQTWNFKKGFAPLWIRYHVALPRQTLPQATKAFIYFYSTHHQPALCSVGLPFPFKSWHLPLFPPCDRTTLWWKDYGLLFKHNILTNYLIFCLFCF